MILSTSVFAQKGDQVKLFSDKSKSTITYSMNHPMHSWTGLCKDVTSVLLCNKDKNRIDQVAVAVSIASFDSQNANRDSHAMEVTEALKFPVISFSSTSIKQEGENLTVTGNLKFHDVTKSITFTAVSKVKKDKIEVTGNFEIDMTEYKVEPPSLMGVATDKEIKLSFDIFY